MIDIRKYLASYRELHIELLSESLNKMNLEKKSG